MEIRKLPVVAVVVIVVLSGVDSAPRKKLVKNVVSNSNRRSSTNMLSSTLLSDYWRERGFHDSPTDHLIASESNLKSKDILMMSGDEIEDFRGSSKIRIPRGRLMPPAKLPEVISLTASISIPRKTKRLHAHAKRRKDRRPLTKAAQRRQDMEILESVTLVDGGVPTNMADGSLQIIQQASPVQSQRKYRQEDEISPVTYAEDDNSYLNRQQRQQQQQQPVAEPSIQASYHALPPPSYYQNQYSGMGKAANAYKEPKSLSQLTQEQFEREVYQTHQQQPHQPSTHYGQLPSSPSSVAPPQKVAPFFLIQKQNQQHQQQQPYQHPLSPPLQPQPQYEPAPQPQPSPTQVQPQPQYHQHQPSPIPPPSQPQNYPQNSHPQEVPFNTQLFQQQFQHPFAPQSNQPSPLAQVTASILSAASGVASAAANALANSAANNNEHLASPSAHPHPQLQQLHARNPFAPVSSAFPPTSLPQLAGSMLSAAASIQSPEILLPSTTPLPSALPARPGVVLEDEQVATNQLVEPENLANQLTRIYETGRKILYFPKGVVDTVDTFLKQMERNPMVAYWGDKFFAKVFGDTSGT